jgi:hypothetical protein
MVLGDAAVQHPPSAPPASFFGQDAGFAGIAVKERTVERHQFAAQQLQAAGQQHKLSIGRPQPGRVVPGSSLRPARGQALGEIGDHAIAGRQTPQQPDHLGIAPCLSFQPARRAHLVEIAVQVKFQQIARVTRRLAGTAVRPDTAEIQCVGTSAQIQSPDSAHLPEDRRADGT